MLTGLTRMARVRAASILVALYAVCLVTPVAGFAFGSSEMAVHCLTGLQPGEIHGVQHDMPMMDDGAMDDHAAMADDSGAMDHMMSGHMNIAGHTGDHAKGHAGPACCGMMCISALPADIATLTPKTVSHSATVISSDAGIPREAPERLYRPPITLLS
jgi:hypothetical protein